MSCELSSNRVIVWSYFTGSKLCETVISFAPRQKKKKKKKKKKQKKKKKKKQLVLRSRNLQEK